MQAPYVYDVEMMIKPGWIDKIKYKMIPANGFWW